MSDAYLGEQDQGSTASEFNATSFHIEQEIAKVSTATLVKIVKAPYDKDGNPITRGAAVKIGYIDVQPLVNQIDGRGKPTPHGTIHRLSYHRYQGGNTALIVDPAVGDIGKMVVADRDTSAVRATDKQANPGSRRKFDKADGTYFGTTQGKDPPTQWIAATADGIEIVDRHGNKITMGADGIKFLDRFGHKLDMVSAGVDVTAPRLTNTGEIVRGFNTGDSVTLGQHTHNQGNDSAGDVEMPTNAPNAGT